MNSFSSACDNFGLTISTKKTEVLYQPAPGRPYQEPNITVKGQKLQAVESFTYLGSTLSRPATIDAEINNGIAKASSAFERLKKTVWKRRGITMDTRIKVYKAVVLTSLLYGCETWTIYRRHEKLMQQFRLRCLHSILRIRWQDMVPDTEVLERAGLPSVITTMLKSQTRWAGHVSRMPDSRIPKQIFYGELRHGKRSVGCPRKRYKDTLKVYLKDFAIDTNNWELSGTDRRRSPAIRISTYGLCKRETEDTESPSSRHSRYHRHPLVRNLQEGFLCSYWPHQPPTDALLRYLIP